jgi:hypothetical protein
VFSLEVKADGVPILEAIAVDASADYYEQLMRQPIITSN